MEFYAEHLYTFLPMTHTLTEGAVKNPDGQCIDKMGQRVGGKAGVYYCHGQGGNQGFMYTKDREMRGVSVTSMTHTFRFWLTQGHWRCAPTLHPIVGVGAPHQ